MTVAELILFLQMQPQDMPVVYRLYSDYSLLEAKDIEVENLCIPRSDGYVPSARPDRTKVPYLVFPGN